MEAIYNPSPFQLNGELKNASENILWKDIIRCVMRYKIIHSLAALPSLDSLIWVCPGEQMVSDPLCNLFLIKNNCCLARII